MHVIDMYDDGELLFMVEDCESEPDAGEIYVTGETLADFGWDDLFPAERAVLGISAILRIVRAVVNGSQ